MGLGHSPKIVTSGLVLYLDAANPKSYPGSGTTINNLIGTSNNGVLSGGVGFNNENEGIFTFDGSNDQIDLSVGFSITNNFSVEF
jgi:hypothetical protein